MVKFALPPKDATQAEQGFSLVSVLIIMGIVLLAILMITQSRVNQQSAQKAIKLKQSYTDVNQALISDLVSHIHSTITSTAPCITLSGININMNGLNVQESSAPAYVYTNNVPLAAGSPQLHTEARNRCTKPRLPSNSSNDNDNKAYFCVRLGKDNAAPKDSIMNADIAFAEVAVELIDLQTQKPISCASYVSKKTDPKDGSAGMAVTMGLYWQAKIGKRVSYSQKALSYIANQN
jgi:type II secretory pathway pseudopilin PulG